MISTMVRIAQCKHAIILGLLLPWLAAVGIVAAVAVSGQTQEAAHRFEQKGSNYT